MKARLITARDKLDASLVALRSIAFNAATAAKTATGAAVYDLANIEAQARQAIAVVEGRK